MASISLQEVESITCTALVNVGTRLKAAESVARAVASAERDGIKSHGMAYVPTYCDHVLCGKVIGSAEPLVEQVRPGAVRVDARNGFAHPAIDEGFTKLIELAKTNGCAVLTIFNSYNCGVLGYHVERLAQKGYLSLGFTNAPASIAPIGGTKPVIGTNPFAIGVPDGAGSVHIVIDQSASVVAKSEVMRHARERLPIPEGWGLDADGRPTTDPERALAGSMVPTGGYKGFGAGLFVELMAAALSGAVLSSEASPFSGPIGGPPATGQCFIALDVGGLSGGMFSERVEALCDSINAQEGARLPGARRIAHRTIADKQGVTVDPALLAKIKAY